MSQSWPPLAPTANPATRTSRAATELFVDHLESGTVRPILVTNGIPDQIPEWTSSSETYAYAASIDLPFDRLALDFGMGMDVGDDQRPVRMTAALVDRVGGALRIVPAIRESSGAVRGLMVTLWGPDSRGVPGTVAIDADGANIVWTTEDRAPEHEAEMWGLAGLAIATAMACLSTLYLTEAMNVSVESLQLTRQMQRHPQGALWIPQLITIEPSRSLRAVHTSAAYSRLTLRHQVRGHYKRHPPGTPIYNANPQARVFDYDYGEVVRIWCPPYIVGPENARLRPQVWKLPGYVETTLS